MSKSKKKKNSSKKGILIFFGIGFILTGLAGIDFKEGIGYVLFCLSFIAIGAVILYLAFKKKKEVTAINTQPVQTNATDRKQTLPTASKCYQSQTTEKTSVSASDILKADDRDRNLFKTITDGHYLAYSYERDFCIIDDNNRDNILKKLSGNGGKEIEFKQEPENVHDENAVAIYFNDEKIGYVYKGQTQDMVNDWLRKDKKPLLGYINRIILEEARATYKVGFYKPLDNCESKSFTITKSASKERQENLNYCSEGDSISVDADGIICDDIGNELGEVPQSFKTYIEDKSYTQIVGFIDEIEVTDNLKNKATATVYII